MKIFSGQFTKDTVKLPYLSDVLVQYPHIKPEIIFHTAWKYPLMWKTMAFANYATPKKEQLIGDNAVRWFLQGRNVKSSTVVSASGTQTITLVTAENLFEPSHVIMWQDDQGVFYNFLVVSGPTAVAGGYQYILEYIKSDNTSTFAAATNWTAGMKLQFVTNAHRAGSRNAPNSMVVTPDMYINYNTISRLKREICRDGIQTVMWFEFEGERAWLPMEQYQLMQSYWMQYAYGLWFNQTSMDVNGVCHVQDGDGEDVIMGDGFNTQLTKNGGNVDTFNISAGLTISGIENALTDWGIENGFESAAFDFYAGAKARQMLNDLLKDYVVDVAAGGNAQFLVKDGKNGQVINKNFTEYKFAGYSFRVWGEGMFNDPEVHTNHPNSGVAPLSSWNIVVMPELTDLGTPMVQTYFRAGAGAEASFVEKVISGMFDPTDFKSLTANNAFDGFEYQYLSEGQVICNDPGKCLTFIGTN